jgi:histidinol-phosphate aminotransferase
LRQKGFAIRRGDTFPGLGPPWLRFAARDDLDIERLVRALGQILDDRDGASA